MAGETTLSLVLVLVAVAVLLQAGAMVGIWFSITKIQGEVRSVRTEVRERLDPLSASVNEILTNSREPVKTIAHNLAEISTILRERTSRVDDAVGAMLARSRVQAARIDEMVTGLVERVETTADIVQASIVKPLHEASAVVKGVRAGLEFLLAGRPRANVREATQDEQLFI
jgi:methyl-accepting chemotaxis protein